MPVNAYFFSAMICLLGVFPPSHPRSNHLIHVPRKPAKEAAQPEDDIRRHQGRLASKDIAQFAVQWLERR